MDKEKITIESAFQRISLPTFEEGTFSNKPYVRWGKDNLFPVFLQDLANRSALHNAIISSKVDYSYADGCRLNEDTLSTKLFFDHPNPYEDMDSIYRKCLYDYIVYGCFALNIIWAEDKKHISEIYHVDASKIRSGKKNEHGMVDEYFYCDDWTKASPRYKSIGAFNLSDRTGGQLLFVKEYRPGTFYYPLPSYVGALNYITIDAEISNFHLSHILNGMAPNFFITFTNGVPTEEERKKIKAQLISEYTGSDNAGKLMVSFVDDPEKVPHVETLSADNLDEQFIQLSDQVLQNILSGHKVVSPVLVGIKQEGISFGSGEEMENAYNIYINSVIKPIQSIVIDSLNKVIVNTKGWSGAKIVPTLAHPFMEDEVFYIKQK